MTYQTEAVPEESEAHCLMFLKTFLYEALVHSKARGMQLPLRDKDDEDIVSSFYSLCLKMSQGMKCVGNTNVVMLHFNITQ